MINNEMGPSKAIPAFLAIGVNLKTAPLDSTTN